MITTPDRVKPLSVRYLTKWITARWQLDNGVWCKTSDIFDEEHESVEMLVELRLPPECWDLEDFIISIGEDKTIIGLCEFANSNRRAPGGCMQRIWIRAPKKLSKSVGNNPEIYVWTDETCGPKDKK